LKVSKYKAANGIQLTQGLFYEFNKPDAPYTLRSEDYVSKKGIEYKSVSALYRDCSSEYEAAILIVESWEHWKKLCSLDWFVTGHITSSGLKYQGLNDWKEEQELRKKAVSEKALMGMVEEGNVTAAKFIYEQQGKQATKGRPETKKPKEKISNVESLYAKVKR
jgi:hypothetical protein